MTGSESPRGKKIVEKQPLIVIIGPTAVGKTSLSLALAEAVNGEIIGADSRQVYRYMDIGTAKPVAEDRARVPHHMIDVVNPDENLSLAQYQKMTMAAIAAIHQRGHIPLLVGGTGQYISAVIEGWSIPEVPPNPNLRAELEAYAAEQGSAALHARLHAHDPAAAAKIEHQNVRRVVRALEVCIETGRPISELQRKQPPNYRVWQIGLTMAREQLYERVDRRVDEMIDEGFVAEVQKLLNLGYERSLPSMSGLGYAQLAAHLLDNLSLSEAIMLTKNATHDFIRRQYTWFRKYNDDIVWHDTETTAINALVEAGIHWLEQL